MNSIGNNPLLAGARGMLGKAIVFRQLHGKTILSNRPKRPATITAHQEMMKSRFKRAVEYAKKQMHNEHSNYKGAPGDTLLIHATDDFKVTAVSVTISNSNGIKVEQGNAILPPGLKEEWRYVITETNSTLAGTRILVKAMDQPGNVGLLEVII